MNKNELIFPSPLELREVVGNCNFPIVFKNIVSSWSIPWTVSDLTKQYGSTLLDFRLVPKSYKGISWESQHEFVEATISNFISWQNEENNILNDANPFKKFKKDEHWAYSSYNRMTTVFSEDSDIVKGINWNAFGIPAISGKDGTFWLGSEGAYTPCHFDTYGYNLVAQILGRKKWTLFPPSDTSFMYPTRIPYEESSVFSSVNILNLNLSSHSLFQKSHPHEVILEPGDVLFVPKHWWHFVLNLDSVSTSINEWIKLGSDSESRLEEGVVRALMSSLISFYEPEGETWLNPKEDLVSSNEALKYITTSLQELNINPVNIINPVDSKVLKTTKESDVHSRTFKINAQDICDGKNVIKVGSFPFHEWLLKNPASSFDTPKVQDANLTKIMNSFVHPEVISLICHLLKKS